MSIITISKDNTSLCLNVNVLQLVDMLSKQSDYINDKSKVIYIYYNIAANSLYVSTPISLEKNMGWGANEKDSIRRWIPTFNDYCNGNCLQGYLNWLHGNFGTYAILYGKMDLIGEISKPSHLILDAHFNCTASICVGIYRNSLSVVGLQRVIAADLQKVLQECKYTRIDNGRLTVVVN